MRIIIVINDSEVRRSLVRHLGKVGYEVIAVESALEFYRRIDYYACRFAVIDTELPDQSSLVLVEFLKKNTNLHIAVLVSGITIDERLEYYQAGADMLVEKPVECREIAALVGNVFDRIVGNTVQQDNRELIPDECGKGRNDNAEDSQFWTLSSNGWILTTPQGASIELTLREFKFVLTLSRSPAIAVSRKDLLQMLEYQNDEYGNRALESVVHRLRGKIMVTGYSPVKTAHGIGYSFASTVRVV